MDERELTRNERIHLRHWLQELSEHVKSVRNAMDPQHGMPRITLEAWKDQLRYLTYNLEKYTESIDSEAP